MQPVKQPSDIRVPKLIFYMVYNFYKEEEDFFSSGAQNFIRS